MRTCCFTFIGLLACTSLLSAGEIPDLPASAKLEFTEDWASGKIDPQKWYLLRKKWGKENHGVVPENVRVGADTIAGRQRNVLVCTAHGDRYDGPVIGFGGNRQRVGGVIVTKAFFASGRFEIVMKVGSLDKHDGGPENPAHPSGTVPAIWTYAYRWVSGDENRKTQFTASHPLYNPHMPAYGSAANEYWSELDFPELGKGGDFTKALFNTFCQNRHEPKLLPVTSADGKYHTYTTDWRTQLVPIAGVTDAQVVEHDGYHWVQNKSVPFGKYLGNPLKRLARDRYAVYTGLRATHWIDGKLVGHNDKFVPSMAAQLNLGVWLPHWAGPAPWKTAEVRFGSIMIWQYHDPGDVHGVLADDIPDNFGRDGRKLR